MSHIKKLNSTRTPLWCTGFIFVLFLFVGCEDPVKVQEVANPYKWQLKQSWTSVHPYHYDGHYYIFPIKEKSKQLNFTKVNEKSGEIVFDKIIFTDIDVFAFNAMLFEENGRLVYLHGKYIFQLDKNTGDVFAIDTFTNYIHNTVRQDGYFTGSAHSDNFTDRRFFEIIYEGGHYIEKLIHKEYFQTTGNVWAVGSAPIKLNGKWVMAYSIFDLNRTQTNSWIITKDGNDLKKQVLLPGFACAFELFDENNIYLGCSDDRFICISKSNFQVKWDIPSITGGEYVMYKDKIFVYNRDDRKRFHTINKYTGQYTVFSGFIPGNTARLHEDRLLYVGDGKFRKLALETLTYDYDSNIIDEEIFIGEFFGFSDKTRLLWNDDGWKCSAY